VVARAGGVVAVAGGVVRAVSGDGGDHGAVRAHPGDGHVVVLAAAADRRRGRTGGAAERDVAVTEVRDRLAEVDAEVDRRAAGRVGLGRCLVDRPGGPGRVVRDRVVGRRRGGVGVVGRVLGASGCDRGADGAVGGHTGDGDVVRLVVAAVRGHRIRRIGGST